MLNSLGVEDSRIHVVYRGIDIDENTDRTHEEKTLDVIIVERLVPVKRTADSLQVFRQIRDGVPNAQLAIAGDGPEQKALEEQVAQLGLKEAVKFLGHVSREEIFAQCSATKVLSSMSLSERLPNTVKEAMLRNCIPVVAHTIGIDELISDQETGFIVEQGNTAQAADTVVRCLQAWDDLAELRNAARLHIIDRFNSQALARQRIGVWHKAAAKRCRSET